MLITFSKNRGKTFQHQCPISSSQPYFNRDMFRSPALIPGSERFTTMVYVSSNDFFLRNSRCLLGINLMKLWTKSRSSFEGEKRRSPAQIRLYGPGKICHKKRRQTDGTVLLLLLLLFCCLVVIWLGFRQSSWKKEARKSLSNFVNQQTGWLGYYFVGFMIIVAVHSFDVIICGGGCWTKGNDLLLRLFGWWQLWDWYNYLFTLDVL